MASPQKGNGHTPINHETMQAIILYNFNLTEMRVLLWILRCSWGWNSKIPKQDLSTPVLSKILGINRGNIHRAIQSLRRDRVLNNDSSFQKDYDFWKRTKRVEIVDKPVDTVDKGGLPYGNRCSTATKALPQGNISVALRQLFTVLPKAILKQLKQETKFQSHSKLQDTRQKNTGQYRQMKDHSEDPNRHGRLHKPSYLASRLMKKLKAIGGHQ